MAAVLTPAFCAVCALLLLAGALKLRSPAATAESIVLVGLPRSTLLARALGAGEAVVGAVALTLPTAATAAAVALAYASFAVFLLALRRRGGVDCGCFGGRSSEANAAHVAFDLVALVVAASAAAVPAHGVAWVATRPALVAIPLVAGSCAAAAAAYLAFAMLPALWRSYAP